MFLNGEVENHQGVPSNSRNFATPMARQGALGVEEIIRRKVANIRHWKMTTRGKRSRKMGFEFTVMTYNILSQNAIENHKYLYKNCCPRFLDEDYRISKLLPEILHAKSDVICLQEVEQQLYDNSIRNVFDANGFASVFKKKTGSKSDGCAILWRRNKFLLLRHKGIEFLTPDCEILDKDNVGLIAVLKPRHPGMGGSHLHVATTHLLFNPKRGDIKLCQLRKLLAELETMALRKVTEDGYRVYHPIVLCGDFNFEPHSPLYEFIEKGRLSVKDMKSGDMSGQAEGRNKGRCVRGVDLSLHDIGINEAGRLEGKSSETVSVDASESEPCSGETVPDTSVDENVEQCFYHDFNFVPTYKYLNQHKKNLPVTSMTGNEFGTVDHIFYNVKVKHASSFIEDQLKLLGSYTLMHAEDLMDIGGLPNACFGSDHICLMSKFLLSFKKHNAGL